MRVFSACMKMMKGHKATLLIYVTVFAGLLLTMTFMGDSGVYSGFQGQRPKYALINRDEDSALVQGLAEVLEHTGTRIELEDSREAMTDAGFYQAVECIFLIPEGYGEKLKKGADAALEMWQWPSSASGYYLRSAAEQYLLLVQMYQKTGDMTDKGIAEAVAASMEKDTTVEMRQYMDGAAVSEKNPAVSEISSICLIAAEHFLCQRCIYKFPEAGNQNAESLQSYTAVLLCRSEISVCLCSRSRGMGAFESYGCFVLPEGLERSGWEDCSPAFGKWSCSNPGCSFAGIALQHYRK